MTAPEIERLINLLAKLPGLGPRSARRAVLAMMRRRETLLVPLAKAITEAAAAVRLLDAVRHDDGSYARYYHLRTDESLFKVGDSVEAGQHIAFSGNTGYTGGPHLHLDVVNLLLHGHDTQSVAANLEIARETVKLHRRHAYAKLRVSSQGELFYKFLRWVSRQHAP